MLALFVILTSFVGFSSINKLLEFNIVATPPKRYNGDTAHKWRTTLVSLSHAALISVLSHFSLPYMWSDLIEYSLLGDILMCIIIGYDIYDTLNILRYHKLHDMMSVVIHHILIAIGCCTCVLCHRFFGFGTIVALIEVNAVCLHVRQLLRMYDVSKTSREYKLSTMAYIVSFLYKCMVLVVVFIICYGERDRMHLFWNTVLLFVAGGLLYVNIVLFKRFLTTQFLC